MGALVSVLNGEPRTTSLAIASGAANEHRAVIQLVRNYKSDLEEFGLCAFEMRKATGSGRPTEFATLNEPQAALIMTYMKNTPIVREFKKRLIKEFYEMAHNQNQFSYLLEEINIIKDRLVPLYAIGGQVERLLSLEAENSVLKLGQKNRPTHRDPKEPNALFKRFTEVSNGLPVNRWCRLMNIPYSTETVNSVLYRDAKCTAPVMACIMKALGYPEKEIAEITSGLGHAPGQGAWRKEKQKLILYTKGGELMEQPKTIDTAATNARFSERCISRSAWATKHGINPNVFSQRLNGRLEITPEIAELLRKDDLLVEI